MNSKLNHTATPPAKKKQSKYHEKVVIDATYDEILKMALTTPLKKKKKAA